MEPDPIKHRGKGQQKVTVEHVTANAGGQTVGRECGEVTAAHPMRLDAFFGSCYRT
jgi:hypothetical protein